MQEETLSNEYEKIYLHLLSNDKKINEEEKIKCIIKLLENEDKYYLYSYIILRNHDLIIDWFECIEYFIFCIKNNVELKQSSKLKLIKEMLVSELITDDKKYINELK